MDPPCVILGKHILPTFRLLLAKELILEHGLTQSAAAKRLEITQPAISQYMNSKRASKGVKELKEQLPVIQALAKETAQDIVDGSLGPAEITMRLCKLCTTIRENYVL